MTVTEIFKSIQGESSWAGLPCVFVRLTGCNLRCTWCDTQHAYDGGTQMTVDEVVERVREFGGSLVEITGGEPLLQQESIPLAERFLAMEMTVLCETNGTQSIDRLPGGVIRIMDLKCPGSGACDATDWSNIDRLGTGDEVKFVIADRHDYEWSREIIAQHGLPGRCNAVLFSPATDHLEPKQLVEWILQDRLDVRFQLQLHKNVWGPDMRGV